MRSVLCIFLPHTERLEASEWFAAFVLGVPIAFIVASRLLAHPAARASLTASAPVVVLVAGATVFAAHEADSAVGRPFPLPWSLLLFLVPVLVATTRYRRVFALRLAGLGSDRARPDGHSVRCCSVWKVCSG